MKNLKRIIFLALCMLLALQAAVCVGAEEEYVQWERFADRQTVTGDKAYTLYMEPYLYPIDFYVDANTTYRYANRLRWTYDGVEYSSWVHAPHEDADFIWVSELYASSTVDSTIYLYTATEEARQRLDDFFAGENSVYRLEDPDWEEAYLTEETVQALVAAAEAGVTTVERDVRELAAVTARYEITVHDATESLAYTYGMVYRFAGKYYYVHYPMLGNQHFDADGEFSYRSGSVTLAELDAETAAAIEEAAENTANIYSDYDYEEDGDGFSIADPEVSEDTFWETYVFVGFILPVLLAVLGLVLPKLKSLGKPKYWYALTAVSGVWLLLATLLTVILV